MDLESLSDHVYIDFKLKVGGDCGALSKRQMSWPSRWNIKKMDKELFVAALELVNIPNSVFLS